jgi:hypothetical protein
VENSGAGNSIIDDLFFHYTNNLIPKKLNIQQLKDLKGFENISDDDASNIIDELYKLSIITYKIYNRVK